MVLDAECVLLRLRATLSILYLTYLFRYDEDEGSDLGGYVLGSQYDPYRFVDSMSQIHRSR